VVCEGVGAGTKGSRSPAGEGLFSTDVGQDGVVHFGCAAQQRIGERCGRKLQQVVDTDGSNSCGRLVMATGSHRAGAAVAASGDRPHRRSVLLMAWRRPATDRTGARCC